MRISESLRTKRKLPSRGRLWWKEEFYSIYSIVSQMEDNPDDGVWVNVWSQKVEIFVYKHNYFLWNWWVNRHRRNK